MGFSRDLGISILLHSQLMEMGAPGPHLETSQGNSENI